AQEKLKFEPLSEDERNIVETSYYTYLDDSDSPMGLDQEYEGALEHSSQLLKDGGRYSVHNPDFLTGANISVAITDEFMRAVENDDEYSLRFPDVENYDEGEMGDYNQYWHEIGDVREW